MESVTTVMNLNGRSWPAKIFLMTWRIDRIGGNDAVGLGFRQDFFQHALEARETAELFFDERIFQQRINAAPEFRGILHDAEIGLSGERVERAVAVGKEVEDFGARVFIEQFNRVTQTAGGGVVPVTESGRQNEDFFHLGTGGKSCR
jgi:adenylate cyclase